MTVNCPVVALMFDMTQLESAVAVSGRPRLNRTGILPYPCARGFAIQPPVRAMKTPVAWMGAKNLLLLAWRHTFGTIAAPLRHNHRNRA